MAGVKRPRLPPVLWTLIAFDEQHEKSLIYVLDAFALGKFVDQGADEDIRPIRTKLRRFVFTKSRNSFKRPGYLTS
ncbi:hypothetical protein, partial [Planctopirus hydrillae]|uniref:hypothetical protein n=1 Tax=Planctopirus hydrillae TaxID=1841610 RepID=UPI00197BEDBD